MLEDCDYAVTKEPKPRKPKFSRTCAIVFIDKEMHNFQEEKNIQQGEQRRKSRVTDVSSARPQPCKPFQITQSLAVVYAVGAHEVADV